MSVLIRYESLKKMKNCFMNYNNYCEKTNDIFYQNDES